MPFIYEDPICKNGNLEYKNKKCQCKVKVKKTIKKTVKKPIKKCSIKKQKACLLKNKICNIETNRCKNPLKTRKKKIQPTIFKTIIPIDSIIEDYKPTSPSYSPSDDYKPTSPSYSPENDYKPTSPSPRRDLIKSNNIKPSYSPSLNKNLLSLKTIAPKSYIHNCPGTDVIVQTKKSKKCMKWTGAKAKKTMLDNLLSKTHIECDKIIAPKQHQSNCWMNTFFMAWFISDKGRKFNRWFRETMIRGVDPNGREISKKLKKPLWLLNKMIDASLRGFSIDSGRRYADSMDTNEIIRSIYKAVSKKSNVVKTKVASNPLTFYKELYNLISGDFMPWGTITMRATQGLKKVIKSQLLEWDSQNILPKVIFLIFYDDASDQIKPKKIKFDNKIYKLDAIIIRNTKRHHFSACITCNKNEYVFDGASYSAMRPFNWSEKLNKNEEWRFAEQHDVYFNFKKGYQILMYYQS